MPALRAFNRRWLIAEDDVPVPSLIMLLFHLTWIGPIVSWYVITYDTVKCQYVHPTTIAVSGVLAGIVISIVAEASCIVIGMKGTIFERKPRRHLHYFVYINTFAHLVQIAFNGYLTYLVYNDFDLECDSADGVWAPDAFLEALCLALWIYIGIAMLFCVLIFNPRSDYSDPSAWEKRYLWTVWLGLCCWNPFSSRERKMQRERAQRIGHNLCSLFGHADITVTDAWASFLVERMLYRMHRKKKSAAADAVSGSNSGEKESTSTEFKKSEAAGIESSIVQTAPKVQTMGLQSIADNTDADALPSNKRLQPPPGTLVDHSLLVEAQHYFQYALATYGWMLYVFDNGAKALAEMMCGCSPLGWHGRMAPCGFGSLNIQVAMKVLNCPASDLLFLREEGTIPDVLCYIISVDHRTKSIVLSVRGALSIMDNVRDLLFEAADLQSWLETPWDWDISNNPNGPWSLVQMPATEASTVMAQSDYLNATAQTLADIIRQGVLEAAISGPSAKYPGYQLVVTGHSLGAAVAYLMSLRLRLAVPDLKCWAFSPPLGTVSASLGSASSDWCTTVVCGKELPPRYSVDTLDKARDQMLEAGARCKLQKLKVLAKWMWGGAMSEDDLVWPVDKIPEEPKAMLKEARHSAEADSYRKHLLATAGTFGLPGRVFHLDLIGKRGGPCCEPVCCGCCCACCLGGEPQRLYEATWIDAEELKKEGLQMSGRVLSDHMPDFIGQVLKQVAGVNGGSSEETWQQSGSDGNAV